MKIILGLRRHHCVEGVSILLITVALIVGIVGCGPTPVQYNLTTSSGSGGSVTIPGEGTFTYDTGTVVSLAAEAEDGYQFIKWTGDVDTINSVNAAGTNVTVNNHYSITANFVPDGYEAIWSWYDLDAISNNLSDSYLLMNDLDSITVGYKELASETANEGKGWQPIGIQVEGFTGTFDGQGYEISDLFINRPDEDRVGLFSHVNEGGVIQNVAVVNANVTSYARVGGLVGVNGEGTVSDCYSIGSMTGNEAVGGLVGENYGTVSNSYSTGSVTGSDFVGGLVGDNVGTVSNSHYNYDEVLINGENIITIGALFDEDFDQWLANNRFLNVNERLSQENGYYLLNDVNDFKQLLAFGQDDSFKFRLKNNLDLGSNPNFHIPYLAGEFEGNGHKISNLSFNYDFVSHVGLFGYLAPGGKVTGVGVGNVSVTTAWNVGGLVGTNGGTVSDCYSTGSVTGDYRHVGGLMGENYGTVSNSHSTVNVTGYKDVGGLVGVNDGTVSNSYSTGSVTGSDFVGGLVAHNDGTVSKSYSTGSVSGDEYVGGLVGENYEGAVTDSFWDTETSGQATSYGGTGKTTEEMQDVTTFSGATWDIIGVADPGIRNLSYIWNIADNETYPFLSWEPVS